MDLKYIEISGQNILLRMGNENLLCYPTSAGRWIPSRPITVATPEPSAPEPAPAPETPPPAGDGGHSGSWTHPLPGATITSPYGPRSFDGFHAGADLSTTTAARGGNILAPCDLEITQAWEHDTGGLWAAGSFVKGITTSGEPYTFSFFHMALGSVSVKKGDKVKAGTKLGIEGATGNVDGTHLHLEAWPGHKRDGFSVDGPWYFGDGTPIEPLGILRKNGVKI